MLNQKNMVVLGSPINMFMSIVKVPSPHDHSKCKFE